MNNNKKKKKNKKKKGFEVPESCEDLDGGVEVADHPAVDHQSEDAGQHRLAVVVGCLGDYHLGDPARHL